MQPKFSYTFYVLPLKLLYMNNRSQLCNILSFIQFKSAGVQLRQLEAGILSGVFAFVRVFHDQQSSGRLLLTDPLLYQRVSVVNLRNWSRLHCRKKSNKQQKLILYGKLKTF